LISSTERPFIRKDTERIYPGSTTAEAEDVRVLGSRVATPLDESAMAGAWIIVQKGDWVSR